MTAAQALKDIKDRFREAGIESSALDAEIILARVLKTERYRLITERERELTGLEQRKLEGLAVRRLRGEPVAYITGIREFYGLDFLVNPSVLIPRPETELVVDLAVYHAEFQAEVLDLCCGSGAIAVALKHNRPDLTVHASDISPEALRVARKNARSLLGTGRVHFHQGDLFAPFGEMTFDLIISNPPYIDPACRESLQRELSHEPEIALFAGEEGRAVVRRIMELAGGHLREAGMVLLEIGSEMAGFVKEQGGGLGFDTTVLSDYAGLPRVAMLKKR